MDSTADPFRGVICVATKVEDDDGLPYALQRLVLTGSKKYPHKVEKELSHLFCLSNVQMNTDIHSLPEHDTS